MPVSVMGLLLAQLPSAYCAAARSDSQLWMVINFIRSTCALPPSFKLSADTGLIQHNASVEGKDETSYFKTYCIMRAVPTTCVKTHNCHVSVLFSLP